MNPPIKNLVTIIISIHKYKDSLPKTLESISKQSYKNVEMILLFDNDLDIKTLGDRYPIENHLSLLPPTKLSEPEKLNKALELTSGEFIMFLNESCILYPDGINNLVDTIKRTGSSGVIGKGEVNIGNKLILYPQNPPNFHDPRSLLKQLRWIPSSRLYRKQSIKNGFDPEFKILHKWDLDFRLSRELKFVARNILIDNGYEEVFDEKELEKLKNKYKILDQPHDDQNNKVLEKFGLIGGKSGDSIGSRIINNPRVLFYTAITDKYDSLQKHDIPANKYHFICFTNNQKLKSDYFNIIHQNRKFRTKEEATRWARKIKWQIHRFYDCSEYDYVIWLDANCKFKKDVGDLIEDLKDDYLACFRHPSRNCVYEEGEHFLKLKTVNTTKLKEQVDKYREMGFDEGFGLWATHCLVFKPINAVFRFFDHVYDEICENSERDQMAFPVILKKIDLPFHTLLDCKQNSETWKRYISKKNTCEELDEKGESLIKNNHAVDFFTNKIENNEYFKLNRYGDGEFMFYFKEGREIEQKASQGGLLSKSKIKPYEYHFDEETSNLIIKTIDEPKESDSFFYGLQNLSIKRWGNKIPKLNWCDSDIFHRALEKRELLPFLKLLQKSELVFIGPAYLRQIGSLFPYKHFIETPLNDCFLDRDRILKEIRDYAQGDNVKNPTIYIFMCSLLKIILIYELDIPNSFLLDMGAVLDPLIGMLNRKYHYRMKEEGTIDFYLKELNK